MHIVISLPLMHTCSSSPSACSLQMIYKIIVNLVRLIYYCENKFLFYEMILNISVTTCYIVLSPAVFERVCNNPNSKY